MPAEISLELKGRILTLKLEGYSYAKIVEKLSAQGNVVSKRTVRRVIARDKEEANGEGRLPKKLGPQCLLAARTKALVRKVSKAIKSPNPPSQVELARRFKTSRGTIQNVLMKDLGAELRKKRKTHTLTPEQCQQRLDRGPGFLQYLTPRKLRYIFTFDETWITTNDLDGQTDFYYEQENVVVPESWKRMPKSSWPKKAWS